MINISSKEDSVGEYSAGNSLAQSKDRQTFLRETLSLGEWEVLRKKVEAYNPHVIVLLARKMPRAYELLQWSFRDATIISDFTLPWFFNEKSMLSWKEKNPDHRVAIIDDSINNGSTLTSVCDKISMFYRLYHVFVLGMKTDGQKSNQDVAESLARRTGTGLSYVCALSEDQYKIYSHSLAKSIGLISKSYEIEFPILYAPLKNGIKDADHIFALLKKIEKNTHKVFYGDSHDVFTKIPRFSLNLSLSQEINNKIRLYFDLEKNMVTIVPMVSKYVQFKKFHFANFTNFLSEKQKTLSKVDGLVVGDTTKNETYSRIRQFTYSLELFCRYASKFTDICDVEKAQISSYDVKLLFGSEIADKAKKLTFNDIKKKQDGKDISLNDGVCARSDESLPSANHTAIQKAVKITREKFIGNTSIDWIETFFTALAAKVDAEASPEKNRIQVARLRVGPTFEGLLDVYKSVIEGETNQKTRIDYACILSEKLDSLIDSGGIVPVFNDDGLRVYRKGEAPIYDKRLYSAIQKKYSSFCYPWLVPYGKLKQSEKDDLINNYAEK